MTDKLVTTMSGKFFYEVAEKGSVLTPGAAVPNKEYVDNANIVTLTAATTITKTLHAGKTMLLSLLAGFTATMPEATGSGDVYKFKIGIVNTSGAYVIAALTTDTLSGVVLMCKAATAAATFLIDGTDDKLTLNGTTTGGLTIGDTITMTDAQDGVWHVEAILTCSGSTATPASAT